MCEYCEEFPKLLIKNVDDNFNGVGVKIEDGNLLVQVITDEWGGIVFASINFCPMCGRDLKAGE